jgi:hypothetical protein
MPNRCGLMHVRPLEEETTAVTAAAGAATPAAGAAAAAASSCPTEAELDKFWADLQPKLAQFTTLPGKASF